MNQFNIWGTGIWQLRAQPLSYMPAVDRQQRARATTKSPPGKTVVQSGSFVSNSTADQFRDRESINAVSPEHGQTGLPAIKFVNFKQK